MPLKTPNTPAADPVPDSSPPSTLGALAPTGEAPGAKRNAAATRLRILEAAEREFAARGFAGARLREIALNAGVQPALIHHYFTDKRGLYRSVLDRAFLPSSTESWTVLGTQKGLEGLLTGLVDVLVRFYAANRSLLSILRHEALSGSNVLAEVTRERTLPVSEALTSLIEERQAAGEVRSDVSAQEIVLIGMSMIAYPFLEEELLKIVLPTTLAYDEAALARRKKVVVGLLLDAIRSPPARRAASAPSTKAAPKKTVSKKTVHTS